MRLGKITFVIGALCMLQSSAYAINTTTDYWEAWGYAGQQDTKGVDIPGELILDGCVGKGCRKASHGDEGAVAVVVAEQITEHGGFFCPYQFQCANKRKNKHSWTVYYQPNGFSRSKCAWLCEKGYSGVGCTKQYDVMPDPGDVVANLKSGISVRTKGGWLTNYETNITGFKVWNHYWYPGKYDDHGEYDVVLGVVKYLQNGVIATPVQLGCKWDGWKGVTSWVEGAAPATQTGKKLLCKEGFIPNENNTDCVHATEGMLEVMDLTFCENFPMSNYMPSLHRLVKNEELGCSMYFCRDASKAFASAGDVTNCTDCASSIRGGPSNRDGTCVTCNQVGQYFDGKDCKTAVAYSKLDLQYGKGKTKSTTSDVSEQCWIYTSPDEYANCVKAGEDFKAGSVTLAPGRTE